MRASNFIKHQLKASMVHNFTKAYDTIDHPFADIFKAHNFILQPPSV